MGMDGVNPNQGIAHAHAVSHQKGTKESAGMAELRKTRMYNGKTQEPPTPMGKRVAKNITKSGGQALLKVAKFFGSMITGVLAVLLGALSKASASLQNRISR